MAISSVSSSGSAYAQVARSQPDSNEVQPAGGNRDGNADNGGSVPKVTAPKAVLNTHGQKIGTTIDTTA